MARKLLLSRLEQAFSRAFRLESIDMPFQQTPTRGDPKQPDGREVGRLRGACFPDR
jgi:hypothetical protein